MEIRSIEDVNDHVHKRYRELKDKSKIKNLYIVLCREAFGLWGDKLGYTSLSAFMVYMKKPTEESVEQKSVSRHIHPTSKKQKHPGLVEGLTSFTTLQITIFGLNKDTY